MLENIDIDVADSLPELCAIAVLDLESSTAIIALEKTISDNDELSRIFRTQYHRLYGDEACALDVDNESSKVLDRLGDGAFAFNLLLAIAGIPIALAIHNAKQIPMGVTRETLGDISLWADSFRERTHIMGLEAGNLAWCKGYLTGNLFRLGRLQFRHFYFHGYLYIFRHRVSGSVVALAKSGTVFNSRGLRDGVNGMFDSNAWSATLEMTEYEVKGCPIAPNGYAEREIRSLSFADWEHVLSPGDPMLDIHIPAGGGMSPEACASSIDAAHEFFPTYFPEKPFGGFVCRSWFLDPQLRDVLPPESNIIKFQKSCYQFPTIGDESSALQRIFGDGCLDLPVDDLPIDNRLRRAVVEFMKQGGRLGMGACFFLKGDLPWRMNVYQKVCEQLTMSTPSPHE